jgi:hypothetical protein
MKLLVSTVPTDGSITIVHLLHQRSATLHSEDTSASGNSHSSMTSQQYAHLYIGSLRQSISLHGLLDPVILPMVLPWERP